MPRRARRPVPARAAPARGSPILNDTPPKRGRKSLNRKAAISDDELSEGGIAEMVHEQSGGRWTAFAERAEEPEPEDDDEPAAGNGDAGADENDDEDEDDEDEDDDMDEDV